MSKAVSGKKVGNKARLILGVALVTAAAFSMNGCASIVSGSRQKINVISEQEGAKVAVFNESNNKVFESKTDAAARLKRGDGFFAGAQYRVELTKEGHDTLTTLLEPGLNTAPYLANLLLGGWLGMLIIDPATGAMWKFSEPIIHADFSNGVVNKYPRSDGYFALGYAPPIGLPGMGAFTLESGWIWGNGMLFGIDFLGGYYSNETFDSYEGSYSQESFATGIGFNLGNVYDLPIEGLQLVYGGGVGFWMIHDYHSNHNSNFLAPFVKLRWSPLDWNSLDFTFRGFLGHYSGNDDDEYSGFGWNNTQISLGIYFEGSKRWKGKK